MTDESITSAVVDPAQRDAIAARLEATWEERPGVYGWLATVDHKRIGVRYFVTAFLFLLVGGIDALVMRLQLARPDATLVTPQGYNQLFTMHGTTMIFWYAAPILSGFGNYLIPLLLGSRDMAFPRLNAFSYWTFLVSGIYLHASILFGLAPAGGWFNYVPLTNGTFAPGLNIDFYALALLFLTLSTTVGAINFIVTILRHRCPGMTLRRMPLMAWSTLTASTAILFGLPPLTAALVFLELDRRYGTHFFDPAVGGSPLLWQHLFWIFGHPWVYIIVLPATGMASMIIPTFCRRRIVGHMAVAIATVSTGLLGFGVWMHHMFATGLPRVSASFFSAASMAVSVPSAVQIFAWLGTIWSARRHQFTTAFLFLLGFIILFTIGGVSGVMTGSVPFDWQATDSYFVVAHLHYVLIGINFFPVMAATYYWFPKVTGRLLSERVGRWVFAMIFTGMNLTFFPMHTVGLHGMPRRVYTYPAGIGWDAANMIETIGSVLFAIGVLVFLFDLVRSARRGPVASANPWQGASLEWATTSPPPPYNFAVIPIVSGRDPVWDGDVAPQAPVIVLPERGKEVLTSTVIDALADGVELAPRATLWPLGLTLAWTWLFTAVLLYRPVGIATGVAACLAVTAGWLWQSPKVAT